MTLKEKIGTYAVAITFVVGVYTIEYYTAIMLGKAICKVVEKIDEMKEKKLKEKEEKEEIEDEKEELV